MRWSRASRRRGGYFPAEQLAISTQCGFASDILGNPLTADMQAAKLRRIAEVAERVWG